MTSFLEKLKQDLVGTGLNEFPLRYVLNNKLYGEGLIIDLGTGEGQKTNLIAGLVGDRKVHSFDWFKGLPENWRTGFPAGKDNLSGAAPGKLASNVVVYNGLFKDTLPGFVSANQGQKVALISVDCDLYQSTKTALSILSPLIKEGTILVFDELIGYPEYEKHEVKALEEFLRESGKFYQVIGMLGDPYYFDKTGKEDWKQQKVAFRIVDSPQVITKQVVSTLSVPDSVQNTQTSNRTSSRRAVSPGRSLEGIKVKVIVPYGRRKVFQNLLIYLRRELSLFDEVIIWQNTINPEDLDFLAKSLTSIDSTKFVVINPTKVTGDRRGVFPVYEAVHAREARNNNSDSETLWIKIDDDVVWVEDGAFAHLIKFAMDNRYKFSTFSANVVNSGPLDSVSKYHIDHSYLNSERWSINCIAYFGSLFDDKDYKGLAKDDERYITRRLGEVKQRRHVVVPNALMVHYSFASQLKDAKSKRPGEKGKKVQFSGGFDPDCEILNKYVALSQEILKKQ
jgi:hypothetical protein